MNILHINRSDISGGAAIAGFRLHQSFLAHGLDSYQLVNSAQTTSSRVNVLPQRRIDSLLRRFTRPLGLHNIHSISTFDILKHPFYKQADVINFHCLHHEHFNYLSIPLLSQKKAVVFTLHDMWSFTGHCSYSYDCERWSMGCGRCPYPHTYPPIRRDNTRLEWKLKHWCYHRSRLTIVTPSTWLHAQAKQSMLNRFPLHCIPNGVDIHVYQPRNRQQCRSLLGIPFEKKVLLFSAQNLTDSRKGSHLLLQALSQLPESLKTEILLLTIGRGGEFLAETVDMPVLNVGYVSGDHLKSMVYSAADLFLFPTRADNLPLVLQESMACGVPMISFDIGGISDLVRPDITGYLARPFETQSFCAGIVQLLEDDRLREHMGQTCRRIAIEEYSIELQTQRYTGLYRTLLS